MVNPSHSGNAYNGTWKLHQPLLDWWPWWPSPNIDACLIISCKIGAFYACRKVLHPQHPSQPSPSWHTSVLWGTPAWSILDRSNPEIQKRTNKTPPISRTQIEYSHPKWLRLQTKYLNTCLIFASDWMIFGFAILLFYDAMNKLGAVNNHPGTSTHGVSRQVHTLRRGHCGCCGLV